MVLNNQFIGRAIYEGQESAPQQVDGAKGNYVLHRLYSERHGIFHVITKATTKAYPAGAWVEVDGGLLYPDTSVNGVNLQPSFNVLAKGLKLVKRRILVWQKLV